MNANAMKANSKKVNPINLKSLAIVLAMVLLTFLFVFQFVYKPNYENLGGEHSWLSGSTLKFVNDWLEEGATKHRFTCYESFDSIEFNELSERTPYVSYPTGSTFTVYAAAKLTGQTYIDVSFLKHFQMVCYALETLLFATFCYLFLDGTKKLKEIPKTVFSALLAMTWMLLPVNVYYLANVYFADQCVILWVMMFLLLEYISHMDLSPKALLVVNILKVPVIFIGVLTDYYFWILVFIAFCMHFIRNMLLKKKFLLNVKEALWYVCPVLVAVGTFIWQLTYTENWLEELLGKFFFRTGGLEEGNVFVRILINFYGAFADANKIRLVFLMLFMGAFVALMGVKIFKGKLFKEIFTNRTYYIVALGVAAPALQILVLKNHSAIHEFSMLKVGWIIVMSIPVVALIAAELKVGKKGITLSTCTKDLVAKDASDCIDDDVECADSREVVGLAGKKVERNVLAMVVSFVAMLAITGVPTSADYYIDYRYAEVDYPLERVLYETMDYEHVCFSFTREIAINPPQHLAVSGKQVHLIESIGELDTLFPDLSEDAVKVLVIDDTNPDKSQEIISLEKSLLENNSCIYESGGYYLVELKNY